MTETLAARRIAWEVLRAVRVDQAYANLLLPVKIQRARLSSADAGFATELCYGTLRMQGYYDRVISIAARRPTEAIDADVLDVLRLGCHQLLTLLTAPHAAVNESVALATSVGGKRVTGFVNGVLRTVSRSSPDEWREHALASERTESGRLATEFSHPEWMVESMRDALAADTATTVVEVELRELLLADNTANRPALAALPGLAPADAQGTLPGHLSPVGRQLAPDTDLRSLGSLRDGSLRVQDEGSQLAALALSRAREIAPEETWLDLCAGPGGKSALLAAEARIGGATLIANEVNSTRAGLVRGALSVFDAPPEVWERDGREIGSSETGRFDRILVDAPCTGLGALRRRPEARWRRQPSDLADLVTLQRELLDSAVAALAPGGVLAYVTCSPHLAETDEQVRELLVRHPQLRALSASDVLNRVATRPVAREGSATVQLWPHRHGTDAMFIALFQA